MRDGGYKIRNQNAIHFITFSVVEWVDIFIKKEYFDIIIKSLRFCQKNKGLNIHDLVIMTNHNHFIFSAREGSKLSNIIRDFKKHTSTEIVETIKKKEPDNRRDLLLGIFQKHGLKNIRNKKYQFWMQDNHPVELSTNTMINQRLDYIHNNPVKKGLVDEAEKYLYSSARDYTGCKGLLEIDFLD